MEVKCKNCGEQVRSPRHGIWVHSSGMRAGFQYCEAGKLITQAEPAPLAVTDEDVEDFKNLVPINIRINTEEWNWFKARLAEEYTENLPNLRALAKHPPKSFKDLD